MEATRQIVQGTKGTKEGKILSDCKRRLIPDWKAVPETFRAFYICERREQKELLGGLSWELQRGTRPSGSDRIRTARNGKEKPELKLIFIAVFLFTLQESVCCPHVSMVKITHCQNPGGIGDVFIFSSWEVRVLAPQQNYFHWLDFRIKWGFFFCQGWVFPTNQKQAQ